MSLSFLSSFLLTLTSVSIISSPEGYFQVFVIVTWFSIRLPSFHHRYLVFDQRSYLFFCSYSNINIRINKPIVICSCCIVHVGLINNIESTLIKQSLCLHLKSILNHKKNRLHNRKCVAVIIKIITIRAINHNKNHVQGHSSICIRNVVHNVPCIVIYSTAHLVTDTSLTISLNDQVAVTYDHH